MNLKYIFKEEHLQQYLQNILEYAQHFYCFIVKIENKVNFKTFNFFNEKEHHQVIDYIKLFRCSFFQVSNLKISEHFYKTHNYYYYS